MANDGNFGQYWSSSSCGLNDYRTNPYWYVDLGEEMSIDSIAVYGRTAGEGNYQLAGGTNIGVSTSECWNEDGGCVASTAGVTVCARLDEQDSQENMQYPRSCIGKQENNSATKGAIGRYVFVWGDYTDYLLLCEVVAMGSPLQYETANGTGTGSSGGISPAPTPASNTSIPTALPTSAPTTLRSSDDRTAHVRYHVFDNDRLYLTWDSALDKCQRRGMALATVRSMPEQAALAAAFYGYLERAAADKDNATETLLYSWVGGVHEADAEDDTYATYGWWWVDNTGARDVLIDEGNYTNWDSSVDSSASDGSLRYLKVTAVSMTWSWTASGSDAADSYVCEERTALPFPTYRRLFESPEIEHVTPSAISAGTVVTITGKHFNATGAVETTNVTIGGRECSVVPESLNASHVACVVPALIAAGVYPLKVSSAAGQFDPAKKFIVTVSHSVYNVTPASGSYGGGTLLTITGANFPDETNYVDVQLGTSKLARDGLVGNFSNSTLSCVVKNSTATQIVCETEAVSGASALFYNHNRSRIPPIKTKVEAATWLVPNGDELRIVSQGQWSEFSDKFRRHLRRRRRDGSGAHGAEQRVPLPRLPRVPAGGAGVRPEDAHRRRSGAVRVRGRERRPDGVSGRHVVGAPAHHRDPPQPYYTVSEDLETALKSCGGSEIWDSGATSGSGDAHQYILIGRCGSGLSGRRLGGSWLRAQGHRGLPDAGNSDGPAEALPHHGAILDWLLD